MKSHYRWKCKTATVLTFIGAAGVVATAVTTAKQTPKALRLLKEASDEKGEELTFAEKATAMLPAYLPAIMTGSATILCIFGANILNKRSQASLVSAYGLLDQRFKDYQKKLIELYGQDAHEKIITELAAEKAENRYISSSYLGCKSCALYLDENVGKPVLFYEPVSDRYFEATVEQVMNAEYHLNRNFALAGAALLNEFYDFIGIEERPELDEMGWAPTDEGEFWIEFNHVPKDLPDGRRCYIIDMPFEPRVNFDDYY